MGITASAFARRAVEKAQSNPPIPYVLGGRTDAGTDCSNLIRLIIRELGGKDIQAGSNAMWDSHVMNRAFCHDGGTRKFGGYLVPGSLLFIDYNNPVAQNGAGTPGKMDHVGIYVGPVKGLLTPDGKQGDVVHASQSRGMVCASTLLNAWTHGAWLKGVDYDAIDTGVPSNPGAVAPDHPDTTAPAPAPLEPGPGQAKVNTTTSGLRLRKQPSTSGAVIKEMPAGAIIDVLDTKNGWALVYYVARDGTPHQGWCSADYLQFG